MRDEKMISMEMVELLVQQAYTEGRLTMLCSPKGTWADSTSKECLDSLRAKVDTVETKAQNRSQ